VRSTQIIWACKQVDVVEYVLSCVSLDVMVQGPHFGSVGEYLDSLTTKTGDTVIALLIDGRNKSHGRLRRKLTKEIGASALAQQLSSNCNN
jgi:hypothetical protein